MNQIRKTLSVKLKLKSSGFDIEPEIIRGLSKNSTVYFVTLLVPPFWVGACVVRHKLSLCITRYQLYQCMSPDKIMSPPDSITTTALLLLDLRAAAVVPR